MALETLLHFENCSSSYLVIVNYLRSVGSMSSSRCVLRLYYRIVFFGHCWPFFVSSIPFDGCYVAASFSWLRVVRFSFRRLCYIFSLELLKLCISFNCCNRIIFYIRINHKTRKFSRHFHSHKMQLLVLLGIFTDRNDRFPHPFIYFI